MMLTANEVEVCPPAPTVIVSGEYLQRLEGYAEAWKWLPALVDAQRAADSGDNNADAYQLSEKIEELRILHGDPNASAPRGTLDAR